MELPKPPHLPAIASDIVAQHEVVDKSQLVDEQQDENVILLREISKAAGNICQAHDNVQSASTEISNSDLSMEAKEELFDREIRPKAARLREALHKLQEVIVEYLDKHDINKKIDAVEPLLAEIAKSGTASDLEVVNEIREALGDRREEPEELRDLLEQVRSRLAAKKSAKAKAKDEQA